MTKTLGIGWIKKNKCGLKRKGLAYEYADFKSLYLLLQKKGIFRSPVENFARFDPASKLISIATGLALYDAGVLYLKGKKQDIGMLATNKNGALDAQLEYFKDYIAGGRILGRGNLFIYTLPSSPLAEAAIHFGLQGPLIYIGFSGSLKDTSLSEYAQDIIRSGQAENMLVINSKDQETTCSLVGVK